MKAVAFESQPEINGFVEKLLIFFFSDNLLHKPSIEFMKQADFLHAALQ